jgi:hypothetical protein
MYHPSVKGPAETWMLRRPSRLGPVNGAGVADVACTMGPVREQSTRSLQLLRRR